MKGKLMMFLFLSVILSMTQGCLTKSPKLRIVEMSEAPLTCRRVLAMGPGSASEGQLVQVLDRAWRMGENDCWQNLMAALLKSDREIPVPHLARAVHRFNKNRTRDLFSKATFRYLEGFVLNRHDYGVPQKHLLQAYAGFEIRRAGSKDDPALKQARLLCSRLDPDLYEKMFL